MAAKPPHDPIALEARRIAANIGRLPNPKSFSDYDLTNGGFCRCA